MPEKAGMFLDEEGIADWQLLAILWAKKRNGENEFLYGMITRRGNEMRTWEIDHLSVIAAAMARLAGPKPKPRTSKDSICCSMEG